MKDTTKGTRCLLFVPAILLVWAVAGVAADTVPPLQRRVLLESWLLNSSVMVREDAAQISSVGHNPQGWTHTTVPSTVLNALVKAGVYPDPRVGLNSFRIPDASDEYNQQHDLAKYSHLPDNRNPWKEPYWYRTEFDLPQAVDGKHVWLHFQGINYRADVWLNGRKVADHRAMVGIYRRFRLDVTGKARPGRNCLAVKVHPVDHPGVPETQLVPFGKPRGYFKEIQKDVTFVMGIGYDCMPTVPDRNMGIWQEVSVDWTGPVDIRDPLVATDLPLPKTSPAALTISADLVNATSSRQKGVCRGVIVEGGVAVEKPIELAPGESRRIVFLPAEFPQLVVAEPRLWWPRNYGPQNLYHLRLTFDVHGEKSAEQQVAFGIRKVSTELHKVGDHYGLRMLINGQKVFGQGGWLQPEILFDMPAERMETEVRYLAEANLTTVTFEDLPVPCDALLEACDRYGLMYWTSFYSSYWVRPGANVPTDQRLLADCAVDVIKRYWNHPSVVLYSCVGEGVPAKDIYLTWRKNVLALDRTRHFIPTIDVRFPMDWLKEDVPTGLHDAVAFDWIDPAGYYQKVRAGGKWMYNTEVSIASLPPVSSLRKFVPNLLKETRAKPAPFSVDATWAHHDATLYMKDYDPAIRRLYGPPRSAEDYCWKAHLVTATQHRAWSEAANHRMWEITSGIWQWKLNSCWPSVGWQIYDWYLKPMVSYYSYKSAFEPLHVQLSPLDSMVTVVNRRLGAETDLKVRARVFDSRMVLKWEKQATTGVEANAYQDVFTVPKISGLSSVYFARLDLTDGGGKLLSENFYWLSSRQPADYTALEHLPTVRLKVSPEIETRGGQTIAHVRLENPSAHLAFFVQLAITKGSQGDEVLPVFWDENYFSLLPKEAKQVDATFATAALSGTTPVVEVGGWNVQTSFDCTDLKLSKTEVPANETVSVAATIKNTFLDGSRIELCVDNEAVDSTFLWARGDSGRRAAFELKLRQPGSHEIKVGNRRAVLLVK